MDLSNLKLNGVNNLVVSDSLNAPLFSLKINLSADTVVGSNNELIIYVDKTEEVSVDRKQIIFNLNNSLQYYDNVSDEFYLSTDIVDNDVKLKCYVLRKVGDAAILLDEVVEELPYQLVTLFEGTNYISTNYEDAIIDIIYPKNTDLVKLFVSNLIYALKFNSEILKLDDIYFKDCFTEVDAGINAAFNKLTTKCFDSPTNAFSMDCDGNLVVNSITTRIGNTNIDFDSIYPIGSVYLSVNNINPSTLFGGTWEGISGYYLYAGAENNTGGSSITGAASGNTGSTVLTTNNLPSHTHSIPALSGTAKSAGRHSHKLGMVSGCVSSGNSYARPKDVSEVTARGYTSTTAGAHTHSVTTTASTTGATGTATGHTHTLNSHTHTVTPPFYSLFVFKRIA